MPISQYDSAFGGKRGSASKAKRRMAQQYGKDKGEQVFYATKNKRQGKRNRKRDDMIRKFQKKHGGSRGRS